MIWDQLSLKRYQLPPYRVCILQHCPAVQPPGRWLSLKINLGFSFSVHFTLKCLGVRTQPLRGWNSSSWRFSQLPMFLQIRVTPTSTSTLTRSIRRTTGTLEKCAGSGVSRCDENWNHKSKTNTSSRLVSTWLFVQVENTEMERFREVYDDFYRMGMEARRLKNLYGVNGTAILM